MGEETVTIDKQYFEELLESQRWLDALESAGVDNWQGYDFALEQLGKESTDESEEDIYGDPTPE